MMKKKNKRNKVNGSYQNAITFARRHGITPSELESLLEAEVRRTRPGNPYDTVFRTEIVSLGRLVILLINHLFGTSFTGNERIRYEPTEYAMRHPGGFFRTLRVDSHFTITAEDGREHTYHVECQTQGDGSILFRIVEYDLTLAADSAAEREWGCEVRLPETGVIFLRSPGKKLKGSPLIYRISNSRGDTIEQAVEAITVEGMPVPALFEPTLLALLPFWLFTYTPERLKALQEDAEGHQKLLTDARMLFERIMNDESLREADKARLVELTSKVAENLLHNRKLKGEMAKVMNGVVYELETDRVVAETEARVRAEEQAIHAEEKATFAEKLAAKDTELAAKDTELAAKEEELAAMDAMRDHAVRAALQHGLAVDLIQNIWPDLSEEEIRRIGAETEQLQ